MGPILILDKSAFESLSVDEHFQLDRYFQENLTPILALELIADIAKQSPAAGRTGEQWVKSLARKFGGSGPPTNIDYQSLCVHSLLGFDVPMRGRILPQSAREVMSRTGGRGLFVDTSPVNEAIMRWADGQFLEIERVIARSWRPLTRNLSLSSFRDELNQYHIIIPRLTTIGDLMSTVDGLLDTASIQSVWLSWLTGRLDIPKDVKDQISNRWRVAPTLLASFAPYARHCIRVLLALVVVTRNRLVKWNPTNILDVQYLYYLPFCAVFSSKDNLHRTLAPLLMQGEQTFVPAQELKNDLRRLVEFWERVSPEERQQLRFALGSHPPPRSDSVVHTLWKKYMRPWRPQMCSLVTDLSEDEQNTAIQQVRQMFVEVEGERYFQRTSRT